MTLITTNDQHYSNIASAIRTKNGSSDTYTPSQMATAIGNIPTGGGSTLGTKTITANGTYNASSDNLDGYSSVTVNVQGLSFGDVLLNNCSFSAAVISSGVYIYHASSSLTARAALIAPIKNKNYTVASADTTKYQIVVYEIDNPKPVDFVEGGISYVGYKTTMTTAPGWVDSYTATSAYIAFSLKKIDGTDFTSSEMQNALGTVFTLTEGGNA